MTTTEQPLILYLGALPQFTISAEAVQLKDAALDTAALVCQVRNADEQNVAVNAQRRLKEVSKTFEDARVEVTKPLLKAQRDIKLIVDKHRAELDEEFIRVSQLVADFQAVELKKQMAAEALKNAELNRIERERQEGLAKAKSTEEIDAVNASADLNAASTVQTLVVPQTRAAGQIVREDWEIIVTDKYALCRAHPQCVDITPRLAEIKLMLNQGIQVQGVKAEKKIKASVRVV